MNFEDSISYVEIGLDGLGFWFDGPGDSDRLDIHGADPPL